MNLNEITSVLQKTFDKELENGKKRHIIFWYDENGDFEEVIDQISIKNARVWKFNTYNLFATKYELEKVDVASNFLLYAPMAKPIAREDWLLDIYKYSEEFSTDKLTVMMRDLGVSNDDEIRKVFQKYDKFFKSKERYAAFKDFNIHEYTAENIDLAVLATLSKCNSMKIDDITKSLLIEERNNTNKIFDSIQKFADEQTFWTIIEQTYGYDLEERSINSLLTFLMLTNLSENIGCALPEEWKPYISTRPSNCIVFLNHFMNHSTDSLAYAELADQIEEQLNMRNFVQGKEIKNFIQSDTFRCIDEAIIEHLILKLTTNIRDFNACLNLINTRRTKYWMNNYRYEYEALFHAITFFKLIDELEQQIVEEESYKMFMKYCTQYHKLDQSYRKFYLAFDQIENADKLYPIREQVENYYTNWYMNELSIKWSNSIQYGYEIPEISQQQHFFNSYVKPYVTKGERVFVIISDALRYEAAMELADLLNKERKASTDLSAMQGVLPSYTDLGMASLLPYKEIKMNQNGEVVVNGLRASKTANRNTILQSFHPDSIAITYTELMNMKPQEVRESLSGKKIAYIYHNTIDARGDNASTEHEIFSAVEQTLREIRSLINTLINRVSASNIIITADHGFIYNRDSLAVHDKVKKQGENSVIEKRRFILSSNSDSFEGTMKFSMDYILGEETDLNVIVPRGANRFAVQGTGANYVHGGSMLQEVVIPIIKFKNDRSKSSKNEVKKVDVKLTSLTRKITNTITNLDFFQIEKIEEKKKPLHLKLYFVDEEGNRISNENIIIADSFSSQPTDRIYKEKFVLKNMLYDKTKRYYLIMEDETTEKKYDKISFTIDMAISNDYQQ